jgi:hypothetical protein
MHIKTFSLSILGVVGLALATTSFASDVGVNQHVEMTPPAETFTAIQKNFPAPTRRLCFGSACMAPSTTVTSTNKPRPAVVTKESTASGCMNITGHAAPVPYDVNGDCTSDLLWMNDQTHQFGWWLLSPLPANTTYAVLPKVISQVVTITPGYSIAASGDLNGDGKADLIWTSSNRDLYLWTSTGTGFASSYIATYPAGWTLVGAADINGDGNDDLIWENQSACEYGYWLMNGKQIIGMETISVTCGYHINFIESEFDSPSGTGPAIYWVGPSNADGVAPFYQWLPQNQTLNASFYRSLPSSWTFAAGSLVDDPQSDTLLPLMVFDAGIAAIPQGGTGTTLYGGYNSPTGLDLVSEYTGQMPGYQVTAAGHYTGTTASDVNTEDLLWIDATGDLAIWSLNPANAKTPPYPAGYFVLGPSPAGWHIVRPGVQN